MMRGLLICVGQLDYGSLPIGPSHEGEAGGKVVGCETGGHGNGGNKYQKRV